jgi:hypothetical protein
MFLHDFEERMETAWGALRCYPRSSSSSYGEVYRRYNPSIIYAAENIRNNYLLHKYYYHSHIKMMFVAAQTLLSKLEHATPEGDYTKFFRIRGFNHYFCMLDWAYEKSPMSGNIAMPSSIGTALNLMTIGAALMRSKEKKEQLRAIAEIYDVVVYPSLRDCRANFTFNIEENSVNTIYVKGADILRDGMHELIGKLQDAF